MIQQLEKQIDEEIKKTYRIDELNQEIKNFKNASVLGYNHPYNNPEEQKQLINNQLFVKDQQLTKQQIIDQLKESIEDIKVKMNEILNQFNLLGQY